MRRFRAFAHRRTRCLSDTSGDVLVFCAFAALTIVMTYPMSWHLRDSLPGYPPEDNFHYLWELWYPAHAIFEAGTSPFNDPKIYSPFGFDLIRHQDLSPATVFLFAPLTYVLGEVLTYNLIVLSSFLLTAFGTYLLCRELWGSRMAAIVAGTAAGFCTYRVTHALGHLSLVNTQWIPFCLLYVERCIKSPTARNGALAGLFYSLTALVTWYYAVGCALMALIYAGVRLTAERVHARRIVRPVFAAALVTALLVVPFALPYAHVVLSGEMTPRAVAEQATYSAAISDFFIPSVSHPIWGRAVAQHWRNRGNSQWLSEWQIYLGIVPLVLAFIGVCGRRTATVWALVAAGGAMSLLALGPTLQFAHTVSAAASAGAVSHAWLPVQALADVPPFSLLRAWSRMGFFVEMVVAVLAARGVLVLVSRVPRPFREQPGVWQVGVVLVALGLTVVDTLAVPYRTSPVQPRRVDAWLAAQPGDDATVDFPVIDHGWSGPAMYRRRVTGKPTVLGYGRNPPNEDFWPMLSQFPDSRSLDLLQWWGVRYVLVDEARYRQGTDFWGVHHTWSTLQPAIASTPRLVERAIFDDVHVYELLPAQQPIVGAELLPNSGFEDCDESVPAGWALISSRRGDAKAAAFCASSTVRVTSDSYFVSPRIPVVPGHCYEVQQQNRGDQILDESRVQVNWLDENGRDLGASAALVQIYNAFPSWRTARASARAPLASQSARVYAVAHRGEVWLDDLSFREVVGDCADTLAPAVQVSYPRGLVPSLTATPNPVLSPIGVGRTRVTWSTGSEPAGPVYVSEDGGPEVLFAGAGRYGSQDAEWIHAEKTYEFRLYSGSNRQRLLATASVSTKREPLLVATPNTTSTGSGASGTSVRWSTGDGSVGEVFVSIDNAPEILFARNPEGSQQANWVHSGSVYVFRLYRMDSARTLLTTIDVRPATTSVEARR